MKKKLLIACILGSSFGSFSQMIFDSVEMTPGYTNESYYSFVNQEQANIDNTTWDIAFDLSGFGSSIRTNEHIGTEVYVYPNGTDWMNVDTSGLALASEHNSETTWSVGAFDQSADPSNGFDLGWGIYNQVTHHINGDSIHILKLSDGSYKKLKMESLASGVYTFKHADLDGANEISATVTKGNFSDKNFAYYSIQNNQVLDREPANNTWDIVFTKYVGELGPGVFYGLTGVLSNKGTYVKEANGIAPSLAVHSDYTVDSVINVIGWDWKSFNTSTFSYDIVSDLSYFIQDQAGNVWHLVFTDFEGSSTGKIVFGKEQVETASLKEFTDISAFAVYPNPATDFVSLIYNSNVAQATMMISNMHGKTIQSESINGSGLTTKKLNVSDYPAGIYFVQIATENGAITQKLVVQ